MSTLDLCFRNSELVIVNKPAGRSLLADRSGEPSLWDELPEFLGQKPYLVHRLDKPTSGVLAIALDLATQKRLTRAFQARSVGKFYLAWVVGDPGPRGTIDLPLKKGRKSRYRVAGLRADILETGAVWRLKSDPEQGHPSTTRFRRLIHGGGSSLLLLAPLTGRTHQLRVHLAWIGHPILGDRLYGRPDSEGQQASRMLLHSHRLVLPGYGSFAAEPGPDWRTR